MPRAQAIERCTAKRQSIPKAEKTAFFPDPGGPHAYLVKTKENGFYQTMINDILQLAAEEKNE